MVIFDLALTGDGYRQLNECAHKLPIHFLGPLRRWCTGRVEEQCPVDRVSTRYGAESQEIRKKRNGISVRVQSIAVTDLGVAVPIGRVGKLQRYKSTMPRAKPLRAFSKHLICKGAPDERRQKLVED